MTTSGVRPTDAPKGPFVPKSSMSSFFSRKTSSTSITNQKPKDSRTSFLQNLKSKSSKTTLAKGKQQENLTTERPNHPAYGLPGEKLPLFGEPSKSAEIGERPSISNLVDLERDQNPSWRPLFGNNAENEVPDVQENPSFIESKDSGQKEKGKNVVYTSGQAPKSSIHNASELDARLPEGLPLAYQIISGSDARKCPLYDYSKLFNGLPVPELWNDKGDTLVYLCPKNMTTPHGPSFLVDSISLQSTSDYWVVAFSPVWQGGFEIDKITYPNAKFALFFAADRPDGKNEETDPLILLRHYITMRNVFACIFDSFCVGLLEDDSPLLSDLVDRMLMYFDGSEDSLGDKLSEFIKKSGLWDVSNDPIKAVDLLHLAATYEMKDLYLEAFAHSVGMWPQVLASRAQDVLSEPIVALITARHKKLTENLDTFFKNIKSFHIKELWGVKSPVSKLPTTVRQGYESMRTFLYKYYTTTGLSKWPPKNLGTRPVVLRIYKDFCALYQLLIDRQYTTAEACTCYPSLVHYIQGLSYIDRVVCKREVSMPYGIPILPGYFVQTITQSDPLRRPEVFKVAMETKLGPEELDHVLAKLYNDTEMRGMEPENGEGITTAFIGFEKCIMKGKTFKGISDTRKGIWLIVYGFLSIMAELSVEAGVVFKDDAEYLLCADTTNVFNWEGKRAKQREGDAASAGSDVDRWSLASLPGTQPESQPAPTAGSSSAGATLGTAPEIGTKKRKETRAEMSYPWTVAKTAGWAIRSHEGGA